MAAARRQASVTAVITLESPEQAEALALLGQSDAYHARLYPAESNHLLPALALAQENVRFLLARIGGAAVGCGALLIGGDGEAEIKRMFVAPGARGRQLGRQILLALEREAEAAGVRVIRLETGVRQPEALALYRSHGYIERGPFGSYGSDPLSTFFEKRTR
jgi:putative acetyltransferase